jgi:hypothetical protein
VLRADGQASALQPLRQVSGLLQQHGPQHATHMHGQEPQHARTQDHVCSHSSRSVPTTHREVAAAGRPSAKALDKHLQCWPLLDEHGLIRRGGRAGLRPSTSLQRGTRGAGLELAAQVTCTAARQAHAHAKPVSVSHFLTPGS